MIQYYKMIKNRKIYNTTNTTNILYKGLSEDLDINNYETPSDNDINTRLLNEVNNRQNIISPK